MGRVGCVLGWFSLSAICLVVVLDYKLEGVFHFGYKLKAEKMGLEEGECDIYDGNWVWDETNSL